MQDHIFYQQFKQCRDCGEWLPRNSDYFHIQPRYKDGLGSYCKECHRARGRKNISRLREENPDYRKDYYPQNKDKVLARTRQYYQDHKEDYARWHREWRRENPERVREIKKVYLSDPDRKDRIDKLRRIASNRRYAENPEVRQKSRTYGRNYKARKKGAIGSFTPAEITELYENQGGVCFYCFEPLGRDFHRDHYIPLSRGGNNYISNIVLACEPCNLSKSDKLPSEWLGRFSS